MLRLSTRTWPAYARQTLVAALLLLVASITTLAQASPQPAAAEKSAIVYGAKIHYLEAGSGPVVILLHGLGADNSSWAMTVAPLAAKFRVIAPDQIGFGRSDKPMLNYRIATLVDFLDAFMKQLGIERASLVGNSLGGFTAAAYALAHPEKVERLVLVDAAGFALPKDFDPRILSALNASTREQAKAILALVFYNKQFLTDAAADGLLTRRVQANDGYTVQRFIDSIARGEDLLDGRLGGIKQPTLITWGREDQLTPMWMAERFNKEIAGSQLVVFEKCGHVPQLEKAMEFNAALIKFLSGEMANK
jgi:pimeloyl-ACP methyl ester carboxylesterase